MTSSRLGLSSEKQAKRMQEFEEMVRLLPEKAREYQVDAVLLPGDLWDHEHLSFELIKQFRILYDALCNMAPLPVIIAPGNHDYYSPSSFYSNERLKFFNFAPWPANIHIFKNPQFETLEIPWREGIFQITGRAFHDNTLNIPESDRPQKRLLGQLPRRAPSQAIDIMLFHGARVDSNGFAEKITAPFSRQELLDLGFDYVAVGHYHTLDRFLNEAGEIKGAYAGCPFARGLDETGEKYILIGEMTKEDDTPAKVTLTPVSIDSRQIIQRSLTITGSATTEEVLTHILGDLKLYAQAQHMIYCELKGQVAAGAEIQWNEIDSQLNREFFHIKLNYSQVSAAYDMNELKTDPFTMESRFIQSLEEKLLATDSLEEREILNKALYLGLDALIGSGIRTP